MIFWSFPSTSKGQKRKVKKYMNIWKYEKKWKYMNQEGWVLIWRVLLCTLRIWFLKCLIRVHDQGSSVSLWKMETHGVCNSHLKKIGAEKRVESFQKVNFRINSYSPKGNANFPVDFSGRAAFSSNTHLDQELIQLKITHKLLSLLF